MTKKINVIIDDKIRIRTSEIPKEMMDDLRSKLIFRNPKWVQNEKFGYYQGDTDEYLNFLQTEGDYTTIPRGFINKLLVMFNKQNIMVVIKNNARKLNEVDFNFTGKLQVFQDKSVNKILPNNYGVLESPTGSGKTIIALNVIAKRRQPTLVVVHSKELLYQWRERAVEFLGIPEKQIGLIGDGNNFLGYKLTIGIINSLYKNADNIKHYFGQIVVDECHRTPSRTFTEGVSAFDSFYMLGLSATTERRDGLSKLIYLHLGDKVDKIDIKTLQDKNKIMTPTLRVRATNFDYDYADDYQEMISTLTLDRERNLFIVNDVLCEARQNKGICLVISDRKTHCESFFNSLKNRINTRLLTGSTPSKMRKIITEQLNNGDVKVLVATAQLIGEGYDLKSLYALFMTTPLKFSGRVKQYVGRIIRTSEGKNSAIIYDYVDKPGVLRASFNSRKASYREMGAIN